VVNGTSTLTGLTPNPSSSVARGFFSAPFKVILSCPDATATIRYTLDGSPPLSTSPAYTAPLNITNTTVMRATAFGTNKVPSRTITHTWLFPDTVTDQPNPPYNNPSVTTDNGNPAPPAPGARPPEPPEDYVILGDAHKKHELRGTTEPRLASANPHKEAHYIVVYEEEGGDGGGGGSSEGGAAPPALCVLPLAGWMNFAQETARDRLNASRVAEDVRKEELEAFEAVQEKRASQLRPTAMRLLRTPPPVDFQALLAAAMGVHAEEVGEDPLAPLRLPLSIATAQVFNAVLGTGPGSRSFWSRVILPSVRRIGTSDPRQKAQQSHIPGAAWKDHSPLPC
jgi:hypothetical protein